MERSGKAGEQMYKLASIDLRNIQLKVNIFALLSYDNKIKKHKIKYKM